MKWTRFAGAVSAVALALGMSAAGVAEEAAGVAGETTGVTGAAASDVCAADAARLCAEANDESTRTLCLMQHEKELSDACRTRTRSAWDDAFAAACAEDSKLRCADVPPGGLGRIACLTRHRDELSEPCGSYLQWVAPKKQP